MHCPPRLEPECCEHVACTGLSRVVAGLLARLLTVPVDSSSLRAGWQPPLPRPRLRSLYLRSLGDHKLLSVWTAVAGHPPRPPTDGICDLQASIADCSCGELDPPPETWTSLPEKVGSAKSGTPWARMHLAQFSHACCWAGESCWPVAHHGDVSDLHACRAPWNAADCGSIPAVLNP